MKKVLKLAEYLLEPQRFQTVYLKAFFLMGFFTVALLFLHRNPDLHKAILSIILKIRCV